MTTRTDRAYLNLNVGRRVTQKHGQKGYSSTWPGGFGSWVSETGLLLRNLLEVTILGKPQYSFTMYTHSGSLILYVPYITATQEKIVRRV